MTFDCVEELEKIKRIFPGAEWATLHIKKDQIQEISFFIEFFRLKKIFFSQKNKKRKF
jgi:hypothetical protein